MTQMVKNLRAMWETWVHSLGWEDLLEETLQYSCLENPLGQRSLPGYSPWVTELDVTEGRSTKPCIAQGTIFSYLVTNDNGKESRKIIHTPSHTHTCLYI